MTKGAFKYFDKILIFFYILNFFYKFLKRQV